MGIERAFTDFQRWLRTWPNAALSVILVIAALLLVWIAIRGTPMEKAVAAAYVIFP